MGAQQFVAESVYYLLGGEDHVCPNITEYSVYCIGAAFCVMLTLVYVVHRRAAAKLTSMNVRIRYYFPQTLLNTVTYGYINVQ